MIDTAINTFGCLLDNAARNWPDNDAVIFPETRQTFSELYDRSMLRARQLNA